MLVNKHYDAEITKKKKKKTRIAIVLSIVKKQFKRNLLNSLMTFVVMVGKFMLLSSAIDQIKHQFFYVGSTHSANCETEHF